MPVHSHDPQEIRIISQPNHGYDYEYRCVPDNAQTRVSIRPISTWNATQSKARLRKLRGGGFPNNSRVLVEYGHLIHHHSFPRECIGKSFPVDRVGLTVFYPILPVNDDRMHHPDFDPFPFPLSSHNFHFCNSSIHLVTLSYRFGFHGTLWFYSGISVVALLYGFFFMPDYSRYVASSYPRYVYS